MRKEKEFVEALAKRGLDENAVDSSLRVLRALEAWLAGKGLSLDRPELRDIEAWIAERLAAGEAAVDFLLPATRYFAAAREEAIAIRLMAYLLPIGILPDMADRLARLEGSAARDRVTANIVVPPAGSPPEEYPPATARFVGSLESELGAERARRALTWNVHGIPAQAFAAEREIFLRLGSVDAWLEDHHRRQVDILRKHAEDGTLWFEQRITRAVVDLVESKPEMLSGVRVGDTIYMTKIPYDPDRYLRATDSLERRRLACHCPLAAASITEKAAGVPPLWCACSAGFAKFRFDVVFGQETEAFVLESVLAGAELCRFAIKIPASIDPEA